MRDAERFSGTELAYAFKQLLCIRPLPTGGMMFAIYSTIEMKIPEMQMTGLYNLFSQRMTYKQPDSLKKALFVR